MQDQAAALSKAVQIFRTGEISRAAPLKAPLRPVGAAASPVSARPVKTAAPVRRTLAAPAKVGDEWEEF
jgi:hypothetical protein